MGKWCIKVTAKNLPVVGKWFNENNRKGYNLLQDYADDCNAFDWENELTDFEIVKDDNE